MLVSGSNRTLRRGDAPVYSPTKSIADALRNPKLADWPVGMASMKSAVANRKPTPAEPFEAAQECGAANKVKPYAAAQVASG